MKNARIRIGHGYDIHRLEPGRKLVLGGVEIPHDKGLKGHSDADCLTHALSDAIFGALGLADIGYFFPNTDPGIEGINSQHILAKAVAEARKEGFEIQNVDTTLVAEEPKVAPFVPGMKQVLSETLGIGAEIVGIKATTNEGIGTIGRGEGIAAFAVVLLADGC